MLSEREQRTLDEIEMRLVIEDPRFCARMNRRHARNNRHRPRLRVRVRVRVLLSYLGIMAIVTTATLSFAAGLWALGIVLIGGSGALVSGYSLASWHRRRHSHRLGPGAP